MGTLFTVLLTKNISPDYYGAKALGGRCYAAAAVPGILMGAANLPFWSIVAEAVARIDPESLTTSMVQASEEAVRKYPHGPHSDAITLGISTPRARTPSSVSPRKPPKVIWPV